VLLHAERLYASVPACARSRALAGIGVQVTTGAPSPKLPALSNGISLAVAGGVLEHVVAGGRL